MNDKTINVQDAFLNYTRKNKVPVTIFLVNGVKVVGLIVGFDTTGILLRKEGYTQLIYKHAVSTISPHGGIALFEGRQGTEEIKISEGNGSTED